MVTKIPFCIVTIFCNSQINVFTTLTSACWCFWSHSNGSMVLRLHSVLWEIVGRLHNQPWSSACGQRSARSLTSHWCMLRWGWGPNFGFSSEGLQFGVQTYNNSGLDQALFGPYLNVHIQVWYEHWKQNLKAVSVNTFILTREQINDKYVCINEPTDNHNFILASISSLFWFQGSENLLLWVTLTV